MRLHADVQDLGLWYCLSEIIKKMIALSSCAIRCSTLPDVLVSSATYMRYFSFYRQMLMDALLRDRSDIQSTGTQQIKSHVLIGRH